MMFLISIFSANFIRPSYSKSILSQAPMHTLLTFIVSIAGGLVGAISIPCIQQ